MRKFFIGRAIGIAVLLVILGIIGAFYMFNNYIYQKKQGDGTVMEPYRATMAGEYVCLPHADASELKDGECALGLKTEVGEYYGVDFYLMSQTKPNLIVGDRFSANGVIVPLERVNMDDWKPYFINGLFSVTDSVHIER